MKELIIRVLVAILVPILSAQIGWAESHTIDDFGLTFEVPDDWKAVREISQNSHASLAFGLPPLWSEALGQDVENVVSVSVYRRKSIQSLKDLLDFEVWRIGSSLVTHSEQPSTVGEGHVFVTRIKGLRYTTFTSMHYHDEIGYVIALTGTDETYEINLPKYVAFLETLELPGMEPVTTPVDPAKKSVMNPGGGD